MSPLAVADDGLAPGSGQRSTEFGFGHEQQTSPVFRFSDQGTLVLLPGLAKLSGSYVSIGAGGMQDWALGETTRLVFSGNAARKYAPTSTDLGFGNVTANLAVHWPLAGGSLGLGPGLQRLWIAGEAFRDVATLHADWTLGDGGDGHYVLIADWSANRHADDFVDLDSDVLTVSMHRRIAAGLPWLDGLDVEFGGWREHNRHGFRDLANRSLFWRISVDKRMGPLNLSLGYLAQRARFDASLLPGLPARHDRGAFYDLVLDWEWAPQRSLRFEWNRGSNDANVAIYENRYRQLGLSLIAGW